MKKHTHTQKKNTIFLRKHLRYVVSLLLFALYAYLTYTYIVAPYTLRWKAHYGTLSTPSGYSIRGIDISHHQGLINWKELAHATIDGQPLRFAFIKATEGTTHLDPRFNDNFYQARQYGLLRGAYHYFRPHDDPAAQAHHFLQHVHLEDGDLPPVLDIEEAGDLTPQQLRQATLQWLHIVQQRYHVPPILYTYHKFKTQYLSTPEFEPYPYWIAHYYVDQLTYDGEWKFWQHTDIGQLPGISGHVDCNVYNGSMYELLKLTLQTEE